ncbi:hypothetical protein [Aquimarina algiphila]|uniref:Uncharacterized protein n=1 Tax=Aquimarina algiphila TaxID=2047982 RepID=A0A554VBJ4_9FLAO|nr:hypothetical protein [Aquimarina algiphila]TSE03938.1 hypothetical protein FOF46_28145 [Aquimarina algiphila]
MMKLIVENWAQITVVLGIIGYIIKLFLDSNFKKKEISFLKIQEMKLIETKVFFQSYQSFSIALEQYINQLFHGLHSEEIFNKFRKEIRDCHIDFEYKCMTIKLFLNDVDIQTVEEISEVLKSIKIDIERCIIHINKEKRDQYWDKLEKIKKVQFRKELPSLIKKIETSLRKSYNVA